MSKSIFEILKEYIETSQYGLEEFFYSEKNNYDDNPDFEYELVDEYESTATDSYGDRTDCEHWKVFYFPAFDTHIKITGYYSSYVGLEFESDAIEIVTKQTQIISVWK